MSNSDHRHYEMKADEDGCQKRILQVTSKYYQQDNSNQKNKKSMTYTMEITHDIMCSLMTMKRYYLFVRQSYKQKRQRQKEIFCVLFHHPTPFPSGHKVRSKPEAWHSIWVFYMRAKHTSTWVFCCCFSRPISRDLEVEKLGLEPTFI